MSSCCVGLKPECLVSALFVCRQSWKFISSLSPFLLYVACAYQVSDDEVDAILPSAAYALAKIHMHMVHSGQDVIYCLLWTFIKPCCLGSIRYLNLNMVFCVWPDFVIQLEEGFATLKMIYLISAQASTPLCDLLFLKLLLSH